MSRVCRFCTLEEENYLGDDKIMKMAVDQKEMFGTMVFSRKNWWRNLVALALINWIVMMVF